MRDSLASTAESSRLTTWSQENKWQGRVLQERPSSAQQFFIPGLSQLLQGSMFIAIVQFVLAGVLWFFLLGWLNIPRSRMTNAWFVALVRGIRNSAASSRFSRAAILPTAERYRSNLLCRPRRTAARCSVASAQIDGFPQQCRCCPDDEH
jgi:hypothetical protein